MKKDVAIIVLFFICVLLSSCSNKSQVQSIENIKDTTIVLEESIINTVKSETVEQAQSHVQSEKTEQKPSQSEMEQEGNTDNKGTAKINQGISELSDGIYTASFETDSSMFHVNEACDGKGILTVKNGEMTIHISLGSKKILNLYLGFSKNAAKDGAKLLLPTEDTVTYSDGMTEEVYGFDVPVPALDTEFDLALIGTKGKWYDHKVSVSNPVLIEEDIQEKEITDLEDGTYSMEIIFEGGSGKAKILSPVTVIVTDKRAVAILEWNSPNYDYMIVDGDKFFPVNTGAILYLRFLS